jgi:hypothetical protein
MVNSRVKLLGVSELPSLVSFPMPPEVDRTRVFPQSVCEAIMKKRLFIVAAAVLAPLLLMVAFAAGEWRQIGATPAGDQVSVSIVSPRKNGLRSAWVRVQYKNPSKPSQGSPFVELRARVRFNCATGGTVTSPAWFYSKDRSGKLVVSKKLRRDDQFGQASEGNFIGMARDFVCAQK